MKKTGRWTRIATGAGLAVTCLLAIPSSSVADVDGDGRYPGLPFMGCPDNPPKSDYDPCLGSDDGLDKYGWINAVSVGRAGSPVAKQWARIPLSVMANNVAVGNEGIAGVGDGSQGIRNDYLIRSFFVAPKGADHNYGISPPVNVRTVAFGSIPVEVTAEVRQRRGADDLPVPLELRYNDVSNAEVPGGRAVIGYPASLTDEVEVRVTHLAVDGVDVGLTGQCSTGGTARLALRSEEISVVEEPGYVPKNPSFGKFFDEYDPANGFFGFYGGTLNGTLDIPPLNGCTTGSGDNLSPLLTSALSAPDNPVTILVGSLNCVQFNPEDGSLLPPAPGTTTPAEAGCSQAYYEPDGSVTNERVRTVPEPLAFPEYAPGAQPTD